MFFRKNIWLLMLFFSGAVLGQENLNSNIASPTNDEQLVLLRNEASGGLTLHASGWGVVFRKGKHLTGYLKRMFEADIVSMNHPKEVSSVNPYFENAKPYVFGKLNSVLVVRTGLGYQRVLFGKAKQSGVEVRYNYALGFSSAIAKPVYLDILYPTKDPSTFNVVTEKYNPEKHFVDNIYGKASFSNGLDELKFYPGGYVKAGISFEYSGYNDKIKTLEVGAVCDLYPKEIPIMAKIQNKQLFFNFYISVLWGGKW